jgi:GNAT superfamily N-acetyltransferase
LEIRKITKAELPEAMELVWQVFQQFEAPDYSDEGVQTFKAHIDSQLTNPTLEVYAGFDGSSIVGVIATKNEGSHISLFFVNADRHGQGIGRKLFEYIENLCSSDALTVNSSPYAVPIYHRLGFHDTNSEQLADGIRYVPMEYQKK